MRITNDDAIDEGEPHEMSYHTWVANLRAQAQLKHKQRYQQLIENKRKRIEMENIVKNIDPLALIAERERQKQLEKAKLHRHVLDRCGDSDAGGCNYLRALKRAGVPLPEVKGLKGERGFFETGDIFHDDTQSKTEDIVLEKKFPFFCAREIMGEVKVTDRTTIESPCDIGFTDQPIIRQKWKLADGEYEFNTLAPGAKLLRGFDIKSSSDYGYFKTLRNGPGFHWKAQMMGYMKMFNQKSWEVIMVHKEKLYRHNFLIPWDDLVWSQVVEKAKRVEWLTDEIKKQIAATNSFALDLNQADLEYFDPEIIDDASDICWWSCPLSETKEVVDDNGKSHLEMIKPCPPAAQIIIDRALAKFEVGQQWWRGPSHITIDQIDTDKELIYAHNQSSQDRNKTAEQRAKGIFIDSIYAAYDQYVAQRGGDDKQDKKEYLKAANEINGCLDKLHGAKY